MLYLHYKIYMLLTTIAAYFVLHHISLKSVIEILDHFLNKMAVTHKKNLWNVEMSANRARPVLS